MTKKDDFIRFAESKAGTDGRWSWSKCFMDKNTPWSAGFVSACSKSLGLESVIPVTTKAQDVADKGISDVENPGTWVAGNTQGKNGTPQEGDIVLFNWDSNGKNRADSVGVVRSYDPSTKKMVVISGDSRKAGENRSIVGMSTIDVDNNCIKGYFRPDWDSLDK